MLFYVGKHLRVLAFFVDTQKERRVPSSHSQSLKSTFCELIVRPLGEYESSVGALSILSTPECRLLGPKFRLKSQQLIRSADLRAEPCALFFY